MDRILDTYESPLHVGKERVATMVVAVFRRRLKPGKTFGDFQAAWEAERGCGVPARVFNAVSLTDAEEVIESTELRGFFELRTEHDPSGDPRQIPLGSPEGLPAMLAGGDGQA